MKVTEIQISFEVEKAWIDDFTQKMTSLQESLLEVKKQRSLVTIPFGAPASSKATIGEYNRKLLNELKERVR